MRETSASELALLLLRQGAAVQRVVLDPVPEDIAEALVELLSLDREEFVRILLAEEPSNLRGCTSSLAPLLTKAVSETTGAGAAAPTNAVPCLGAS